MFSLLKRTFKTGSANDFSDTLPLYPAEPAAQVVHTTSLRAMTATDLPQAEVREGNQEADWAAWEDSVTFQDSQFPADMEPAEPPPKAAKQATNDVQDAFASVGKYAP